MPARDGTGPIWWKRNKIYGWSHRFCQYYNRPRKEILLEEKEYLETRLNMINKELENMDKDNGGMK